MEWKLPHTIFYLFKYLLCENHYNKQWSSFRLAYWNLFIRAHKSGPLRGWAWESVIRPIAQRPQNFSDLSAFLSIEHLPAILWGKYYVVLALPFCMRKTIYVIHGNDLPLLFGAVGRPHLHSKANGVFLSTSSPLAFFWATRLASGFLHAMRSWKRPGH